MFLNDLRFDCPDLTPELTKSRQHVFIREIGVSPAWIGQHEDTSAFERLVLTAKLHQMAERPVEDRAKQRHANERDDVRLPPADFPPQHSFAGHVLGRFERVDPWRRAWNQVGDAQAPLDQPSIVEGPDGLVDQLRVEEKLPETIRIAGEMMADSGGSDAGVDADQQHADRRPDAIFERR